MVYLILKELAGTAEDVIMSTSIIMKDTTVGSDVLYRANSIRALCRIIDVSGPPFRNTAGCANMDDLKGYDSAQYRTSDQNGNCRQDPVGLFSRPGFFLPPSTRCARRGSQVAE